MAPQLTGWKGPLRPERRGVAGDAASVDERTVLRAEVLCDPAAEHALEAQMVRGHPRVGNVDAELLAFPAEGERLRAADGDDVRISDAEAGAGFEGPVALQRDEEERLCRAADSSFAGTRDRDRRHRADCAPADTA